MCLLPLLASLMLASEASKSLKAQTGTEWGASSGGEGVSPLKLPPRLHCIIL